MRRTTTAVTLFAILAFTACDSASTPAGPDEASAPTNEITELEAGLTANTAMGVERAEMSGGFCFFVTSDDSGGFAGFSGASTAVSTHGGVMNYHCKGDVLFGELTEVVHLRDVTFLGDFFVGTLASCNVRATPGPNGQAIVSCHDKD